MGRRSVMLATMLALAAPGTAVAAPANPFGHECRAENGVRFCPTTSKPQRVKSFDGIPLDVDVTLPPEGDGPFPTIVMLHGFGGNKENFERNKPDQEPVAEEPGSQPQSATTFHYNNTYFARRGYAVVNYSARGFGEDTRDPSRLPGSCGDQKVPTETVADRDCAKGYVRLADTRFEARDTQHLLGLLVDQGITDPGAIGVTGISYGGGQSTQLAFLRDRIRNPDGSFSPWRSPAGVPLAITAAWPRWPWSDLVYSLLPNGRYLDFRLSGPTESRDPFGIPIQSYIQGLFAAGKAAGYFCGDALGSSPCDDPSSDLNRQFARILQGEPADASAAEDLERIYTFKSGISVPGPAAPVLCQNGWTDDLFPVSECLRVYNRVRAENGTVSLQFGDLGHARGSNKVNVDRVFNDQGSAFFDAYLKRTGTPPAPSSVTAFTQTCPKLSPGGGPFTAGTWAGVHPGAVRFGSAAAQTVTSTGGNPDTARRLDPITNGDACATTSDETAMGAANYRQPVTQPFTLLGRPTVTARVQATGLFGQLDSRLFDVAPDGTQRLISRGAFRLLDNQAGDVTFQLNGNGYRFEAGHTVKLELVGRDNASPGTAATIGTGFLRPSNGAFSVSVSDLTIELPTAEAPNGGQIVAPMFAIDPAANAVEPARPFILLSVKPRQVRAGTRTRFTVRAVSQQPPPSPSCDPSGTECAVSPAPRRPLAGALVRFAGRTGTTDARGRVSFNRRFGTVGSRVVRATKSGFQAGTATVRVVRRGGGGTTGPRGGGGPGSSGDCNRFTQSTGTQRYRCQRGNR